MDKSYLIKQPHPFRLVRLLLLVLLPLFYLSCKKGGDHEDKPAIEDTKKGFHNSEERPQGEPFILPNYLTIQSPINGYSKFQPERCDNKEEKDEKGVGDLVQLCLSFYNSSDAPITITLPAGLVFISKNLSVQNGILVEPVTIVVPPKAVFFQPLRLCCLNSSRDGSSPGDEFELGPVTKDADMLSLLALLSTKKISQDVSTLIQSAVWTVTTGNPLTTDEQNRLAALPNK